MKRFFKNLIYAKIGAGLLGSYLTSRKKNQAIEAIEQSEFYNLIQRLKYHPLTHRNDGFYKILYQFKAELNKDTAVTATVETLRSTDNISLDDSLEINVHSKQNPLAVKLTVKSKPMIDSKLLPEFIKNGLFSSYFLDSDSIDTNTSLALSTLSQALGKSPEYATVHEEGRT